MYANMKVAIKIITLFFFIVSSQSLTTKCPFTFLYHFGDGISDTGNSVRVLPSGPTLPPTRYPYGVTFPGTPTGRWSDGRVDVDYVAQYLGLPNIRPYLQPDSNPSFTGDGVIFSVAGSTVMNDSFFSSRNIQTPAYNIPLSQQLSWFASYLESMCTNRSQADCEKMKPQNSVVLFEFSELNDIGYALVQGKSIQEVTGFLPGIVQASVDSAKEVIRMGATRVLYTTAPPLGCYPYILTALSTNDSTAYDALGCLNAVNALTVDFNVRLQIAINSLKLQFPAVTILVADYYLPTKAVIVEDSTLGPGGNGALRSCCGIGGRYNYDSGRFCGSPNVPVCPNPNNTVYWDGLHFTQESYRRIINTLAPVALLLLKCIVI